MPVIAAFVSLLLLAPAAAAAEATDSPAGSNGIPFEVHKRRMVVVPVLLDGKGPYRFVLDTGSNGTAILEDVARQFAFGVVGRTQVITPTGLETRSAVRLGRLSVGPVGADGLIATVIAKPRAAVIDRNVVGILGQNFLSQHDYTLDYKRKRLVWSASAGEEPKRAVRLALQPSAGRFLVELPQDDEGRHTIRLVPDSGTNTLVVFRRRGRFALDVDPLPALAGASDLAGRSGVALALVREFRIGSLRMRNQVAALVGRSTDDANEGDGLLPLHLFDSVSFESRQRRLTVRPR
jgi:hypothetical protein